MADPWRFRPPVPGDPICPVCSFQHLPFCPAHHTAGFRPPPFPGGRPMMPPPPIPHHANSPYPAPPLPPLWQRPMAPPPPSPLFAYGPGGGEGWNGDGDAVEYGRVPKRTRLDGVDFGNQETAGVAILSDEERRLNLIRDHGGGGVAASRPPQPLQFRPDFRGNLGPGGVRHVGFGSRNGPSLPPDMGFRGPDHSGFGMQISNNGIMSNADFSARKGVHGQAYNHHLGMQVNGGLVSQGNEALFPVQNQSIARQDGFAARHPSEIKHGHWPEDVYRNPNIYGGNSSMSDGGVVHSPVPPLPPQPYPPCPPLPPPSQPHLSPASGIKSPLLEPMRAQVFPIQHSISNKPLHPLLPDFADKELVSGQHRPCKMYSIDHTTLIIKNLTQDKPKTTNATHLFKHPHRATRPDHFVVILRGLPGSGKSYLAKLLRDVEIENGGTAPRIHSMDDYFMTEVEKVEEIEGSKSSSGLIKGKKRITKKVMEYCYEPEMEEAYRASMLKAFKKTLEEGIFTFIIVDDRNLRVADFAQFWAAAKTSGYEVYVLEATYKDPVGCAARNVHGLTLEEIQKMSCQWERAPPLYLQLDVQSLFCGDELSKQGIQEVDMDMEDTTPSEDREVEVQNENDEETSLPSFHVSLADGSLKNVKRLQAEEVKELGKSKWSEDLEEDIGREKNDAYDKKNALSGLIQAYSKGARTVHWGDQVGKRGFSISAAKKSNISLIIGPGAGYNLVSNPLPEEEKINVTQTSKNNEPKKRTAFLEHLRAERESFRAVFDRRRQRIGGFEVEDD